MEIKMIKIIVFVQNKYHELLLIKEIQSRLPECDVISVQSKREAIQIMSTESVRAIIVEIADDEHESICNVHQMHLSNTEIPIIALVNDDLEAFLRKLVEVGVTEILQKKETFYVAVPQLLQKLFVKNASSHQTDSAKLSLNQSEHIKLISRTLSHEINNPLMSILGLSELILDEKSLHDSELIEKIKIIQKSALRIQQSTHRMSNISSPAYLKTPNGVMIDPKKSRIRIKSKV